jgi:RNA polymerase sigma factor (sigma-70 family)
MRQIVTLACVVTVTTLLKMGNVGFPVMKKIKKPQKVVVKATAFFHFSIKNCLKLLTNEQKKCKLYSYYKYNSERRKKVEEKIEISILLSLYGNLLTETQRKYMELYYNEDLSLSEIGDNENITRQAVRTILVKSKKKLQEYEQNLKFMQKEKLIKKLLEQIEKTDINKEQQKITKEISNQLDF